MRRHTYRFAAALALAALSLTLGSATGAPAPASPVAPRITAVFPRALASVGDTVSVYGENLGSVAAVRIGPTSATIATRTPGKLTFVIPSGATTGRVGVRIGSAWAYSTDAVQVFDSTILEYRADGPYDPRWRLDGSLATTVGVKLFDVSADGTAFLAKTIVRSSNTAQLGGGLEWDGSLDWTVRFIWHVGTGTGNVLGGYLISAADADGAMALRIDNNSGAPRVVTCVYGTCGTYGANGEQYAVGATMPWLAEGDEVEIHWWKDAPYFHNGAGRGVGSGFISRVQIKVNGALVSRTEQNQAQCGIALTAPTAFYLGTNGGSATAAFPVPVTYFRSASTAQPEPTAEFLFLGDSICADHGAGARAVPTFIYGPDERWSRTGIRSLCVSGSRISDAKTAFDGYANRAASSLKAVVIDSIGTNDVVAGSSAATITAALQTLVSDIASTNPTTKIIVAEMTPARNVWSAGQLTVAQTVNSNIAGSGGTPLTGAHCTVTQTFGSAWHSGDGVMYSWLGTGDYEHPNDGGRELKAGYDRACLVSTGAWQ